MEISMHDLQILITAINESKLDDSTKLMMRQKLDTLVEMRMTHRNLFIIAS